METEFGKSINDFLAAFPKEEKQPSPFFNHEQKLFHANEKEQQQQQELKMQYIVAREIAVSYIGIGQKFSGAVYRKLLDKQIPAKLAAYVIARLIKDGYINDDRLIESRLENRRCRDFESLSFAKRRFVHQGCSLVAYQRAVQKLDLNDMDLCASYVAEKHGAVLAKLLQEKGSISIQAFFYQKPIQKIARQTMSRGFSPSLVRSCIIDYLTKLNEAE